MKSLVQSKLRVLSKGLPTFFTFIRFLTSMDFLMSGEL
ncbi:unnamed protein product [Gulo gulo]|uniref:Uncharacterized protein n=1 Tax=Gulo gulo TaxID=48420 RepID=A0A9X9LWW4_GULGU|nr:unnamed protein product [Gulo gulo]